MFNLTRQEKLVLIFIASAILLGVGIKFGLKRSAKLKPIYNLDNLEAKDLKANLKIDLNSAGLEDLGRIPGIGPVLAGRIIDYRNAQGPFKNIESLRKVKGFGIKKFDRIKDYLIIAK